MPKPDPPLCLVRGDKFNISLGMLLGAALAMIKDNKSLPRVLKWQLCTYTAWSCNRVRGANTHNLT